jgi:hypothetical protein
MNGVVSSFVIPEAEQSEAIRNPVLDPGSRVPRAPE